MGGNCRSRERAVMSACKSSREATMPLIRIWTVPRFFNAVMLFIASSTRM